MKNKFVMLSIVALAFVVSGCSSYPVTPSATSTPTLTPTSTATPEPTSTPTTVYNPTATAIPTLTADEVSACPQILYDALAESSAKYKIKFPGFNAWNGGSVGGQYYAFSLSTVKTFTIDKVNFDAVKLASVYIDSKTGKPAIRTNWQLLGRDFDLLVVGHPYEVHSRLVAEDCHNMLNIVSCAMDDLNTLIEQGVVEDTAENMQNNSYLTRDQLIEMYSSDYYFVNSFGHDIAGGVYSADPFRFNFEKVGDVNDPTTIRVNPDFVAYELKNEKAINKWISNEPYPEDWINTIFEVYRTEPISALETVSVDKVRACLDALK